MYSITADDVGSALLITLMLVAISITIVGGLMWWLYRFFKNKDSDSGS